MKKWIALLLAAALALGCVPALAESYTVDQKFWGQVQENGLRVSVTFSVAGDKTALIAPETWAALQALAPRLSLEGENSAQKSGAGQAGARVLLDGQAVGMADVRYDNGLIAWTSDLLSDSGAFYAASQDWNPLELLETALRKNQAWPSLALALLSAKNAPQEWQTRAQPLLEPYQAKLGVWLNGYAVVSNGTQDGVAYTELACRIPVQAVKAEIKQLLIDFYADEALLSLLREVFTAQEAAAYLQSGMRDTFFTLLDQLEISGEAEIVRRYDVMGNLLLDRAALPFAASQPLSALQIETTPAEAGQRWAFTGETRTGVKFDVSCIVGEGVSCAGSVRLETPEADEGFVVSDTPAVRTIAFDYNLDWEEGEETYSLAQDLSQRAVKGTLVVKPQTAGEWPAQSLTLDAAFSSKSDKRAATRLTASLTWADLESGASIAAQMTARTAAGWTVESLPASGETLRMDLLAEEGRAALLQSWGQRLAQWFQEQVLSLLIDQEPANG